MPSGPPFARRQWRGLLFACVLAAAVAGYYATRVPRAPVTARAEAVPPTVTVATLERRALPLTVSAVGRAEAKASVELKSRVDGQVAEVTYAEGQPVHKGQPLLRIDPAILDTQTRQAEGVLARDQAQVERLRGELPRSQALAQKRLISETELLQAEANLKVAEATLQSDRASLDNARLQGGYARVVAPIDGVAGALRLPVGGAAKANETTLLVINQIQPIYVTFTLPETRLSSLREALARGPVPVTASAPGQTGDGTKGRLAFIDNAVDVASGTLLAKTTVAK